MLYKSDNLGTGLNPAVVGCQNPAFPVTMVPNPGPQVYQHRRPAAGQTCYDIDRPWAEKAAQPPLLPRVITFLLLTDNASDARRVDMQSRAYDARRYPGVNQREDVLSLTDLNNHCIFLLVYCVLSCTKDFWRAFAVMLPAALSAQPIEEASFR